MGKISIFFRLVFSILLGFLPSFLFIWLFLSHGSPFSNYINFMSNFHVSKWAWILAASISFLIFLIWTVAKSKSSSKKYLLTGIIIFLLIGSVLVFAQAYMYITFFLGGDTLVQLSTDKQNIIFDKNIEENIEIDTSVTLTPLCTAECNYELFDLSTGESIETGTFTLNSVNSDKRTFTFNKDGMENGQSLKRFTVSCKSKKTRLCYTLEKENGKSILITVNKGLTKEDKETIEPIKAQASVLLEDFYKTEAKFKENKQDIESLNKTTSVEDLIKEYNSLSESYQLLVLLYESSKNSFENQDIESLSPSLESFKTKLDSFKSEREKLDFKIETRIDSYNIIIDKIRDSKNLIEDSLKRNLTESDCEELNSIIIKLNELISSFSNKAEFDLNKKSIGSIYSTASILNNQSKLNSGTICLIENNISKTNPSKISLSKITPSKIENFEEPVSICCYSGICAECCDTNCSNKNLPVIFLHGHSLVSQTPADYSLDTFSEIKEKLSTEGFVDAGTLIITDLKEESGLWGRTNFPFMITSSYFFDIYKNQEGNFLTRSSTDDSIDTYALRLKEIIEQTKYKTGKDKVIIVAHSMGGVVARRYVQIFGQSNIDKIILVTVPNKGVNSKTSELCGILGSNSVCRDLNKESLFMNKLNNAPTEKPKTYNLIGIGCDMGTETGDGVVENSSQYLDYATNYYIEGKCDELSFNFIHNRIGNPELYPEAYQIIRDALKNQ